MIKQRKLVLSKTFQKSFQKFTKGNLKLRNSIFETLTVLETDAFQASLRTHKLSGKLASYLACSCGYDCRIIFVIKKDLKNSLLENVILLDIGTHDEVY